MDHPAIVPVYDVGRMEEGYCYVVSKLVTGRDLAARLQEGRPSALESTELVARVAEALHFAHQRGLVHRDIKPANILLDSTGCPLVADFGLALRDESYGQGSGSCGTVVYMSPEQAAGRANKVDGRSDIYSLGVVLYEMICGVRPYRSQSAERLIAEIADEFAEVRPPRQVDVSVPAELERICLKAMAKRPAERYTAAADMAADLRCCAKQSMFVPGSSRHPWRWIAAAAVAVVCSATIWIVNGLRHGPLNSTAGDVRQAVPSGKAGGELSVERLRVLSLDIEHLANLGTHAEPRGILGKRTFTASLGDRVTVLAALSRPAYAYVIAFRPDGVDELCFPEDEDKAPPLTDRPRYTLDSPGIVYGLDEGTGLWVFAVVARDEPLPPYREWRSWQTPPPWPNAGSPLNVAVVQITDWLKHGLPASKLVLWDDGEWLESQTPAGKVRRTRGSGSNAAGAMGFVVSPRE